MADMLIRGIEMPERCDLCPLLTDDGDYDVCYINKKFVPWEWKSKMSMETINPKPDWCPLIELPPHGRLIDADAVLAKENQHLEYLSDEWYVEVRTIENAPTVIEADKDGET